MTHNPSLKRLALVQIGALGMLFVSVIVLGYMAWSTNWALCAFKGDLKTRIEANEALLASSSDPIIHAYGLSLPRSLIQRDLVNQRATERSLGRLFC